MATRTLTQDRLKHLLLYAPDTGVFTRNGKVAGCTRPDGYIKINVDGVQWYAHRLAWLYMAGTLGKDIDHIDRNPSNNKFANLRAATKSENQHNRVKQRNNTSGYKGVIYFKRIGRWRANIWVNNAPIYLGYFDTPAEANAAYIDAQRVYHAFTPNT